MYPSFHSQFHSPQSPKLSSSVKESEVWRMRPGQLPLKLHRVFTLLYSLPPPAHSPILTRVGKNILICTPHIIIAVAFHPPSSRTIYATFLTHPLFTKTNPPPLFSSHYANSILIEVDLVSTSVNLTRYGHVVNIEWEKYPWDFHLAGTRML